MLWRARPNSSPARLKSSRRRAVPVDRRRSRKRRKTSPMATHRNASRPSSRLREPLSEAAAAAGPTRRLSRPSKVCRHLHPTLINVCPCLVRVGFAVILTGKSFRQASHSKQTLSSILSTSFLMNLHSRDSPGVFRPKSGHLKLFSGVLIPPRAR